MPATPVSGYLAVLLDCLAQEKLRILEETEGMRTGTGPLRLDISVSFDRLLHVVNGQYD